MAQGVMMGEPWPGQLGVTLAVGTYPGGLRHGAAAGGTISPGAAVGAAQVVAQRDLVVAHARKQLLLPSPVPAPGCCAPYLVCTSRVTSPRAALAVVLSVNRGAQSSRSPEGEDEPKSRQAPVQHGRRVGQGTVGLKVTGDGQKKKKK